LGDQLAIVHTESSLGWGGQELRILAEAQGLARRGHELTLLCPPEARIYTEAPAFGLQPMALPIAKKRLAGLRALRRWLAENRCDVLSTHSSTDSWLAALATEGKQVPIVRTRHISAPVPRNVLTRWLYHRAARIVTTGEALKRELIERTGVSAERIESVPTGQTEAARSTGLGRVQTMLFVVLPQAVRNVLPDLLSNTLEVVKLTSLGSVVAMPELLFQARQAQSLTYNPTPIVLAALVYFVMLWPLVRLLSRLENRALAQR